jgi:CRISPR-associated Csx2 family protein
MHLISFLGRVPKSESGYRTTVYKFSNGDKTEPVSFIGWPLIERLSPSHILVLGTQGSMWDHLLDSIPVQYLDENLHMELMTQVENKQVEQVLLDRFSSAFAKHLGVDCNLVVIPYGKDMAEQIEIMEIIEKYIPQGSQVSLDITHGFRHLPMLGLVTAQYLQRLKNVDIDSIYYGMYDPDLGVGEVYNLKGMLQLESWVFALSQFDKDGDYSVFSEPLKQDGFSDTGIKALEKAAYFERTFNVSKAKQQLNTFGAELGEELPQAGKLFTSALKERVEWAKNNNLLAHQRKLAHFYLDNGDYVRASIFALEAFITSLLKADENEYNYDDRQQAIHEFKKGLRGDAEKERDYKDLNNIRNAFAHGTKGANKKYQSILETPEKLDMQLHQLFKRLGV